MNAAYPDICSALPGIHAFSGCDFNPAFYKIGKVTPLKVARSDPEFINAMINISDVVKEKQNYCDFVQSQIFKTLETYLCRLYGFRQLNDVNEARYRIYDKTYNVNKDLEILKVDVKNVDACSFLLCRGELYKHVLRAGFIANMWQTAHVADVSDARPTDYGWTQIVENGIDMLDFDWFEGNQYPDMVDIIHTKENVSNGKMKFL